MLLIFGFFYQLFLTVIVFGQSNGQILDQMLNISVSRIPKRSEYSIQGSEFIRKIGKLSPKAREAAIYKEVVQGNIPDYLRNLKLITISYKDKYLGRLVLTMAVMPDYLSIGSKNDYVRIPMGLKTARKIGRSLGFVLPTFKMVDAIYKRADMRLQPLTINPKNRINAPITFFFHNQMIKKQIVGYPSGKLLAGHKKDIVHTYKLKSRPGKIAIYGWHRGDGSPIQPLSLVHADWYVDYSHGVRLVSETVLVNGKVFSLRFLYKDPAYSKILENGSVDYNVESLW